MREVKFRGKRVDNGKWIFGTLLDVGLIRNHGYGFALSTKNMSASGDFECIAHRVNPETVGQYAGLKDKNGKEIYEGDIVRCRAGEEYRGISEYDATFPVEYGFSQSMWEMLQCSDIEVIGNIHEGNKEGEHA